MELNLTSKMETVKDIMKDVVKSKVFITASAVTVGTSFINTIKTIDLSGGWITDIISKQMLDTSMYGIAIGSPVFKMLGYSFTGGLVVEGFRIFMKIRDAKEDKLKILAQELFFLFMFLCGMFLLGRVGGTILKSLSISYTQF